MSSDFGQFRQLVLVQVALQEKLREIEDHDEFIRAVVEMGNDKGFVFDADEVRIQINNSRRSWIERWI